MKLDSPAGRRAAVVDVVVVVVVVVAVAVVEIAGCTCCSEYLFQTVKILTGVYLDAGFCGLGVGCSGVAVLPLLAAAVVACPEGVGVHGRVVGRQD